MIIRDAEPVDVEEILHLIRELALYEKAPHEVTITEQTLLEWGFGEKKFFHVFVAVLEEKVVGMALCYPKFSTWKGISLYLEDIIVTEKYRKSGIGSRLFEKVIDYGKKNGYYRLEWQVLDWNKPAIEFYKKYGAEISSEWLNGRIILPEFQFPDKN
ncbi:MAG: GNAT family N-acetyltransferase [Bacteroidia bacterium]|nr:GNAT family N-acetyltransferase [Bacteroidia bacterium]